MKAEHNQSCGLPFTDTRKDSPRLHTPKIFPPSGLPRIIVAERRLKLWDSTGHSFEQDSETASKNGNLVIIVAGFTFHSHARHLVPIIDSLT